MRALTDSSGIGALVLLRRAGLAVVALALGGCTYGFLYTNICEPLDRDMDKTYLGSERREGDTNYIKEPLSGAGITVEWASHAIGDIAKREGLHTVTHADLHTVSVLGGIWKKVSVQVYGYNPKKSDLPAPRPELTHSAAPVSSPAPAEAPKRSPKNRKR